ncbi:uncharacterized protein LOC143799841 [Ranitomeya variabilis]|uniref:uncharacterized protein LOC143799841 n=1 Tax=Ranitomeya variabilis TaxID=490064 RepID=UPI004057635E
MKDCFNKGIRAAEEQARSGAAASKSVPYKYNRALQFLRPVLTRRQTHSSTLQRAPPCEAELHGSPSDPSQPSHSDSRLAPPSSGEPAAGTSGFPLPEASGAPSFGNSRQRQRASDRSVMPEFLHLGTVFQNGFKALSDKMSSMERRLEILEAELSNPAKHFLSTIAKGMVENLTPELQISVMQDYNTSYVRALQQSRRMQSATLPVVPSLASMTPTTAAEPLQPTHPGPSAERRHHRHHSSVPPTPAPARPSSSRSHHSRGDRGKKRKHKSKRTRTEALAAPVQTTSRRRGSSRSRSSQSQPRTSQRLVLPPPSPAEVAVCSPLDLPSSLLDYRSTSSSSSSSSSSFSAPHSEKDTYHSPFVAQVDTP